MSNAWIAPAHLPTSADVVAFLARTDVAPELKRAEKMRPDAAVELIRAHCYPDLTYLSYLLAFRITGSLWLDPGYQDDRNYPELQRCQSTFEDMMVTIGELNEIGGEPMPMDSIPKALKEVAAFTVGLSEENRVAGAPEAVDPNLDVVWSQETLLFPLIISLFRGSGLTVPGPFAHYCMVKLFVVLVFDLQRLAMQIFMI